MFYAEVSERLVNLVAQLPANERRQFQAAACKIGANECVPAVFGSADEPHGTSSPIFR